MERVRGTTCEIGDREPGLMGNGRGDFNSESCEDLSWCGSDIVVSSTVHLIFLCLLSPFFAK